MIATILAVQYPHFITKCGLRIKIGDVLGNASPGTTIEKLAGGWQVKGKDDSDCEM